MSSTGTGSTLLGQRVVGCSALRTCSTKADTELRTMLYPISRTPPYRMVPPFICWPHLPWLIFGCSAPVSACCTLLEHYIVFAIIDHHRK